MSPGATATVLGKGAPARLPVFPASAGSGEKRAFRFVVTLTHSIICSNCGRADSPFGDGRRALTCGQDNLLSTRKMSHLRLDWLWATYRPLFVALLFWLLREGRSPFLENKLKPLSKQTSARFLRVYLLTRSNSQLVSMKKAKLHCLKRCSSALRKGKTQVISAHSAAAVDLATALINESRYGGDR